MGRDTLTTIEDEMRAPFESLPRRVTLDYEDAPLDQRTQPMRVIPTRAAEISSPEITISQTRPGFDTLVAIEKELAADADEARRAELLAKAYEEADVLELLTFVVLDKSLSPTATESQRHEFVRCRLWHRLPAGGMEAVRRIDVRPADDHAVLVRVWCAVPRSVR